MDLVLNKSRAENVGIRHFSNQQKIQRHFYRAHACFVKYFLMTKKLQHIKKLAYVTTCGPSEPAFNLHASMPVESKPSNKPSINGRSKRAATLRKHSKS